MLAKHLSELVSKYPGIRLLTGDAYFSGRSLCQAITECHKDYLLRVKGNQKDSEDTLACWFSEQLKKQNAPDAISQQKKTALA